MPFARDNIRLRASGLVSATDETLVRFGSVEPHQVIKTALASADLYGPVLAALKLAPQAVLALSSFAISEAWTPRRLALGTHYSSYYTVEAHAVRELGYEIWPTDTFTIEAPDPNNPVHFDIVIVRNLSHGDIADRTGTVTQRRALRNRFLPAVEPLLDRLQGPRPLSDDG